MSDRSDELTDTREESARSTEDLLSETEDLLAGTGADRDRSSGPEPEPDGATPADETEATDSWWRSADADRNATDEGRETGSSRLSRFRPSIGPSAPSLERYFSPKTFVALVLAIGAGLFAGQFLLPIAGRVIGMAAVAFAVGLFASRRRYLEMTAAGVFVGSGAALANHAILAVAGSTQAIVAVGASVGLVACLGSYYFGRDLRDGLSRDVE